MLDNSSAWAMVRGNPSKRTPSEAPERFWVQVVKHKDGVVWGIVDNSLIFVDWPQGKKIRFSMCRVFDVYAGEA